MSEKTIVITYPPDYDGELHIKCEEKDVSPLTAWARKEFTYTFTHANDKDSTAWDTLVHAAKSILAQEERRLAKAAWDAEKKKR